MAQQFNNVEIKQHSSWFIVVVGVFISCLIVANVIAVKLVNIFGFTMPAGVIIFPISYIFGDILTEVYGYKQARRVIWLGFFCNLLVVTAIYIAQILPGASFWDGQAAYERILGYTPRLLLASFAAYLVGSFANSIVLARLKVRTRGRWLWMRTIGSTLVGEGLDSVVFILVAFAGTVPNAGLPTIIVTQWLTKTLYETIATPLTYQIVNYLKKIEGVDVYDYNTDFNPILLSK